MSRQEQARQCLPRQGGEEGGINALADTIPNQCLSRIHPRKAPTKMLITSSTRRSRRCVAQFCLLANYVQGYAGDVEKGRCGVLRSACKTTGCLGRKGKGALHWASYRSVRLQAKSRYISPTEPRCGCVRVSQWSGAVPDTDGE